MAARLAEAQGLFRPDEAEVFRDGERLVIRLKKLGFRPGEASVTKEGLPLLEKVRLAVASVGPASITIEGHTDASGDAEVNQRLSEQRALAVEEYLELVGVADTEITALGYGDMIPIASNTTKEGRSQNRRVDIILEPTQVAH